MNRTRLVFFFIMIVTVLILLVEPTTNLFMGKKVEGSPSGTSLKGMDQKLPGTVSLTIASSSTKQKWMQQVVNNFHAEGKTTRSGARILVKVSPVLSGGSMNAILDGKLQPDVWSPGAESWVAQFNEKWQQRTNKPLISKACQPTIYTPLGFAMWRPMAEALGWPDKAIGWNTIVRLSADPKGWGSYGHPEWGPFRFGHAHPGYSNAGLLTMTSFAYAMAGKKGTLNAADVYASDIETGFKTLANNTSKYGMVTTTLLNSMVKEGPRYLHAVATFESDTVRLNLERSDELRFPMVFIFPTEGTFWGNHPYCTLDRAEWVNQEQAEAAAIFREYLLTREQQALAVESLLRPLNSDIPLRAPLELGNGTDPRITPVTIPQLPFPNAGVSQAISDLFLMTKRKATVVLVLDTSGSMQGTKIRTATSATAKFLERLHPDDVLSVLTFSDTVKPLNDPSRVAEVIEVVSKRVGTLVANGGTALHAAVCHAVALTDEARRQDQATGENRLYGIVLLSDGEDTSGHPTENQMFVGCLPRQAEADGVKIFPIAFGSGANQNLLKRLADVSGGRLLAADPESIHKVYLKIAAEQ